MSCAMCDVYCTDADAVSAVALTPPPPHGVLSQDSLYQGTACAVASSFCNSCRGDPIFVSYLAAPWFSFSVRLAGEMGR